MRVLLKTAPEEKIIEKISYKGGSPGAAHMALRNNCCVFVAVRWGLNTWAVGLAHPC